MIKIVDEIVSRHTDAEITEYLHRVMQSIEKDFDSVIAKDMSLNLLLADTETIRLVADILKALHKRNLDRQAQEDVIQ